MPEIIRIANCSGFYGDRLAAAHEMVNAGPIDVLTGDYLAELTMAILYQQQQKRGSNFGYVGTFLKQIEQVAGACLDKNIRIVTNAGGLNPAGMAAEIKKILSRLGLQAKIAWIEGDNLLDRLGPLQTVGQDFRNLETRQNLNETQDTPVTANAYLGSWAIKEALDRGADIVICPRVTDASVVIGPAAWKFNWQRDDFDALAGALAAGHIIECGAQCCGGNYAFFQEVPSFHRVGYPIAEIEADGACTITKHAGTGGLISVGTITAQLLYEISDPAYLNPDVTAHFDTLTISQNGQNRVRISGCRGSQPPAHHKVCLNLVGPASQGFEILLTGLDIEKKAEVFLDTVFENLGGREQFDDIDIQLIRTDQKNPQTNEQAHALLRVVVTSRDAKKLGRLFTAKITELGLACIPGNVARGNAGFDGGPTLIHWPALIDSSHICEHLFLDGRKHEIKPTGQLGLAQVVTPQPTAQTMSVTPTGPTTTMPLGRIFGTRSGDKGGNANCGIWAKSAPAFAFLSAYLSVVEFKRLCPDMAPYEIERYQLANIWALNFYIKGVLGTGAAANHRVDRQAKSFGEYLGTKLIEVPQSLLIPAEH